MHINIFILLKPNIFEKYIYANEYLIILCKKIININTNLAAALKPTDTMKDNAEIDILQKEKKMLNKKVYLITNYV